MDDYEGNLNSQLINSKKLIKTIKILVFGDHETGKSSFLSSFCFPSQMKTKKTIGCDVFILKKPISFQILSKQYGSQYIEDFLFEFWELAGEKSQRNCVSLYFKNQMEEFKGALFFFDATNLKTLYSFHSWVKTLFESKSGDNNYNCLWNLPFMLIGNKKDNVNRSFLTKKRNEVNGYMSSTFNCKDGENVLFLSKTLKENELDLKLFELFLNHLCIEYEMKETAGHNSEYLQKNQEAVKTKATNKYTINNSYLKNRFKLNLLIDQKEVANIAKSSYFRIKEKITSFCCFFKKLKKCCFCLRRNKKAIV